MTFTKSIGRLSLTFDVQACGWFITHGGANGTMEALYHGVPMYVYPKLRNSFQVSLFLQDWVAVCS
jgi:hypothetical protein